MCHVDHLSVMFQVSKMIPDNDENKTRQSTLPSLITGEAKRSTFDTVVHNATTAHSQSTVPTKRNFESTRRNPWEEEKRASINSTQVVIRKKSGKPSSSFADPLQVLGRNLCCE